MNIAVEITLCVLAWLVTLIRLPSILRHRAWRTDRIPFRIWVATFFFALTITFLVTPIGDAVSRFTAPNFSRLLAYSAVSLTLYLTASASLLTFPTPQKLRQLRYLKPFLWLTVGLLIFLYGFFVSQTPRWSEVPVPTTLAETAFKLTLFSYATILCVLTAITNYRHLAHESVAITKYRITAIFLTASAGGFFFFTKLVLSLGYVWMPVDSFSIYVVSMALMTVSAILWVSSFMHNNVYTYALATLRGLRCWPAFRDLSYLVDSVNRICPPVTLEDEKPPFIEFLRRAEYYLYRATIRIFDGKTFLEDILTNNRDEDLPPGWTALTVQEANQVFQVLKQVYASGDFWDIVRSFRIASKNLARCRSLNAQEAVNWRPL